MKLASKWTMGALIALVVIGAFAAPFVIQLFFPYGGYGMMPYGWRMPMMYAGYPIMGLHMIIFALLQLGLLALVVLGLVWLVRAIRREDQMGN